MTLKSCNKPGDEDFTRMEAALVRIFFRLRITATQFDMTMSEALLALSLWEACKNRQYEIVCENYLREIGTSDPFPEAEAGDKIEP